MGSKNAEYSKSCPYSKKLTLTTFGKNISNPKMFFTERPLLCDRNKNIFTSNNSATVLYSCTKYISCNINKIN